MLPPDILRQIRRLQIRARRAVQTLLGGEYHSAFKGSGLSFEDVREYQPGDDVRQIDWNVTARSHAPFVKRYIEERELTLLLLVDVSGSLRFGTQVHTKRQVAAELAALVAFCAISNNDRIGLMACTDRVERTVRPNKGTRHVLRLLRDILYFEPEHRGTNLAVAFDHLNAIQKRRAIVFAISDFLGDGFERSLRRTAQQHDLICVRIGDVREWELPDVGLVQLRDAETDSPILIDTSSESIRAEYGLEKSERRAAFGKLVRASGSDLVDVGTKGDHREELLKFFRRRERLSKR